LDWTKVVHAPQYGARRQRNEVSVNQADSLCCGGEDAYPVAGERMVRFHYPRDLDLPTDPVPQGVTPDRPQVKIEIRKSRKIPTRILSSV
jgi:hypothetical protein